MQTLAVMLALTACGSKGAPEGGSSAEPTPKGTTKAGDNAASKASSDSSTTALKPSADAAPLDQSGGVLSADAFCARALKLSEANLGKCTAAEQQNLSAPELDAVKRLDAIKKECEIRVTSTKATFDPKAAFRCIEAAEKRGGLMTFYRFSEVPECRGVMTGTTGEGQAVLYAEECAPGLAWVNNRCAKPGAKNARCARGASGILGDPAVHTQCQAGLACLYTRYPHEGDPGEVHCLEPTPAAGACRPRGADPRLTNLCSDGFTCYQGKCRAQAADGGECMSPSDCSPGLGCEIKGGVFGKCVSLGPEKCLAEASR